MNSMLVSLLNTSQKTNAVECVCVPVAQCNSNVCVCVCVFTERSVRRK